VLRVFGFGSGIVFWLALRFGVALRDVPGCQSALGREGLLCVVRSKSVLLLRQGVELLLDCKVGLGVNDRLGGGIFVWKSGKELFEEHLFCKRMFEVIICCYNPPPCLFEGNPCVLNLGVF
jgi:hypothetical protein